MMIHPAPINVDAKALDEAKTALAAFFGELVEQFGGDEMADWRLTFSPIQVQSWLGNCDYSEKLITIGTLSLANSLNLSEGLDDWRATVIHEFCHAWGRHYFIRASHHTFPFHTIVSLLLTKYGLGLDKSLYNLSNDGGNWNYTPAVFFKLCCRFAPLIRDKDGLLDALTRVLNHFDTTPKTLGRARAAHQLELETVKSEVKNWQMVASVAIFFVVVFGAYIIAGL